jgi:hypothetical protein
MKQHVTLSLFTILLCGCAVLGGRATANDVVVAVLDDPMPADRNQMRGFLWDTYRDKPELNKLKGYRVNRWQEKCARFGGQLTQKAESQGLDAASLQGALDKMLVHADEAAIALLPIGAYQTTLDGMPIWIVMARWEYPGFSNTMSHIRMFAFDQETLDLIYVAKCM